MPFDGSEFSRSPEPSQPGPLSSGVMLAAEGWLRRPWRRLRVLYPGGPGKHRCPPPDAAVNLLRAARALIEAERDWASGAYRTADGRHCAVGALHAAAGVPWSITERKVRREAHGLLLAVTKGHGFDSVERMNDKSTHAQMLAAFDAAIANAASRRPIAC